MDRMALEHRKRCIMWDDEGAGFYMVRQLHHQDVVYDSSSGRHTLTVGLLQQMVNWDWLTNQPAKMPQDRASEPGWCAPFPERFHQCRDMHTKGRHLTCSLQ